MGYHALLQGIFLIQGLNLSLLSPALASEFFATSTTWEAKIPTPTTHIHTQIALINQFSNVARYKINVQKSVTSLYMNNKQHELIKKTSHLQQQPRRLNALAKQKYRHREQMYRYKGGRNVGVASRKYWDTGFFFYLLVIC